MAQALFPPSLRSGRRGRSGRWRRGPPCPLLHRVELGPQPRGRRQADPCGRASCGLRGLPPVGPGKLGHEPGCLSREMPAAGAQFSATFTAHQCRWAPARMRTRGHVPVGRASSQTCTSRQCASTAESHCQERSDRRWGLGLSGVASGVTRTHVPLLTPRGSTPGKFFSGLSGDPASALWCRAWVQPWWDQRAPVWPWLRL